MISGCLARCVHNQHDIVHARHSTPFLLYSTHQVLAQEQQILLSWYRPGTDARESTLINNMLLV